MGARILRPLLRFGLLEYHSEKIADSRFTAGHYYRKATLFDRLPVEGVPAFLKPVCRNQILQHWK
jgi:hypothetical protein